MNVTYNTKIGEVIFVKDNGTDEGSANKTFWDSAKTIFEKLKGKTKSNIDDVDTVSSATVSSEAIKDAVKKALEEDDAESLVIVSQPINLWLFLKYLLLNINIIIIVISLINLIKIYLTETFLLILQIQFE